MQRLKIDFLKFTGAKKFTAKDGTEFIAIPVADNQIFIGQKGAYGEISLMDNRDGADQYGNDGFIVQDVGKEKREAGIKGPIIGNWKYIGQKPSLGVTSPEYGRRETSQNGAAPPPMTAMDDGFNEGDDIPF